MRLCDFCAPFYTGNKATSRIRGKVSQPAIAEFFMETALGEISKIELVFSEAQFRKWFKGDREPKPELWAKTAEVFDETRFSRTVSNKINEAVLPDLVRAFDVGLREDEIPDKFALSAALAKQFGAIARGNGEAENIVDAIYRQCLNVTTFPDYFSNSRAKYSKLKTLLYTSEERLFDEFFVCNTISKIPTRFHRAPSQSIIQDATLEKLAQVAKAVLLVGMGGIGKSMMMRHLFLTSIPEYAKSGMIPILVTLREFGPDNNDLFNLIVDSVHRFDISFSAAHVHKFLSEGHCQILLDGLDEIRAADMGEFQKQLDALMDRYPNNQYVMSTRRFSTFVELSRFRVLYIMPFNNEQALELIDRLEYCPEEPKLKQQFRDKLVKEYFKTHAEFVTNPLFLTLMLMSYHRFADVPEKKYLFYDQAYQTLLQRHDSDKLAYKRVFRSVNDPSDFTLVFREFCAKSYRRGDYEFDRARFDKYFEMLVAVSRLDPAMMKAENFLFDACNSACLMYEEGQSYHFLHRSFQEYFFADYYSRQDDTTLIKLGKYIATTEQLQFDDSSAFDMLYDLAPEKVERFIIRPFLDAVFSAETEREQYWRFLDLCYGTWVYTILNDEIIERYKEKNNIVERYPKFRDSIEPVSIVLAIILNVLDLDHILLVEANSPEFVYEDCIVERIYGEAIKDKNGNVTLMPLIRVPSRITADSDELKKSGFVDRLILDEDGKPAEFGYFFSWPFGKALSNEEKYKAAIDYWERDSCPTKAIFIRVAEYYQALKEKYDNFNQIDDDNF